MKIKTTLTCAPIKSMFWCAYDEDAYDGAEDSRNVLGHGETEADAITDLLEQLDYER